jgi:hypothetical protein
MLKGLDGDKESGDHFMYHTPSFFLYKRNIMLLIYLQAVFVYIQIQKHLNM